MERNKKSPLNYIRGFFRFFYEILRWGIILAAIAIVILYLAGIRPYVVRSGSMEPTIKTGSVCFVNHNSEFSDVKNGDIITFRFGESDLATHRVVSVGANGIVTKGDANETEDATPVTKDIFVGKTIFFIPEAGYIVMKLRSKEGIIMLISFVVLLLILGKLLEPPKPENTESESPEKI